MRKFISEYFSFSKRELRSLLFFGAFLFLTILSRILIPVVLRKEVYTDPELLKESAIFAESFQKLAEEKTEQKLVNLDKKESLKFNFDYFNPNEVSKSKLVSFGLPQRIADNFIKYRKAGGVFKSVEDVFKIYGMEEIPGEQISPWILIPDSRREFKASEDKYHPESSENLIIELNSCSFQSLCGLLPDSYKLCGRILNYKELLGGYHSLSQVKEVYGMTDSIYNSLIPKINIDTSLIKKLSISLSDYKELIRHPYLSKNNVELILSYREYAGNNSKLSEFLDLQVLPDSVLVSIAPYLGD